MTSFSPCEYIKTDAADEIHTFKEIKTDSESEKQRRRCRMSKFLATVTVLLYLCFSVQANKDICYEMINGLDKLNSLYKENRTNVSLVSIDI